MKPTKNKPIKELTPAQKNYLQENYRRHSDKEISRSLRVNREAVRLAMADMGLDKEEVFLPDIPVRFHWTAFFILLIAVAAGYGHTLNYSFHFDDIKTFVENYPLHVKEWTWDQFQTIFRGNRPVAMLTYAVNFSMGRLEPAGYHLFNITVHLLTGFVIYLLFVKTLSFPGSGFPRSSESIGLVALIPALLWTVHPIQTQAVTYVVQRMASMVALFYLCSLLAYVQGRTETGSRSYLWFGISAIAAFLALETKENAVTLPAMMLLYDLFFINRFNLQISRKQWTIFSLVLLIFLGGLLFVIETYKGTGTLYSMLTAQYGTEDMDSLLRTMTEWRVLIYYFFLMIVPLPSYQTLDYEFSFSKSLFDPLTTVFSLSAILLMIGFSIKKARQFPLISFAILWYFINQMIESTFIKLDLVFEHRLYLPSVFLFLFIGVWAFNFLSKRFQKPEIAFVICGVLVSILLTGLTHERNKVWKSSVSLWSDVVAKAPNKSRAWNNLGKAYLEENRFDEASRSFEKAARLDSNNQEAINNLGNALQREGKFELSIKLYQGLLANNPRNPLAHNDIGVAYEALYERDIAANNIQKANEEIVAAQKEFIEAINIDPYYTDAHNNLGNIYYMSKQPDQAIVEYRKVIELNPKHPMAHTNLGMVLATKGELDAARKELELSMQLNPAVMVTHINYGMLLEKAGKLNEALVHYREAIRWAAPQEAEKVRQVKDEMSKIEAIMKGAGR